MDSRLEIVISPVEHGCLQFLPGEPARPGDFYAVGRCFGIRGDWR